MAIIFSDGMEIKDSGTFRIVRESDGLYVVGNGLLCPVNTAEEGMMLIKELQLTHKTTSTPQ